ncbi:HNH endonuclease [Streptomyces xanthochromogenes]|uniref:HNH endonuclease n=1 Tax=Streptomyces xanthochromogenes TaxID=67384 RepID=UPI002F4168F8
MITSRRLLHAAVALAGLPVVLLPAAPVSASPATAAHTASVLRRAPPKPPPADVARGELTDLNVEAPHAMACYSRTKFPHWAMQGNQCDTREIVLQRDGQNVVQDDKCRTASGTWHSEYDGKTLTAASQADIDHMVPLAAAWRAGADQWDTPRRKAFANDLEHSQQLNVTPPTGAELTGHG